MLDHLKANNRVLMEPMAAGQSDYTAATTFLSFPRVAAARGIPDPFF